MKYTFRVWTGETELNCKRDNVDVADNDDDDDDDGCVR